MYSLEINCLYLGSRGTIGSHSDGQSHRWWSAARSGSSSSCPSRTSTLRRRGFAPLAAAACVAAVALVPTGAGAAIVATVPAGHRRQYAVLAGQTVTNTGPSVLNGDLGLCAPARASRGSAAHRTARSPATRTSPNGPAQQAQSDLTVAYVNAAGRTLIGTNDGATSANSVGSPWWAGCTQPDGGPRGRCRPHRHPDARRSRQPELGLHLPVQLHPDHDDRQRHQLISGAQACNVFWQVGSSATLGTGSDFVGTILALTSITVHDSVTRGRPGPGPQRRRHAHQRHVRDAGVRHPGADDGSDHHHDDDLDHDDDRSHDHHDHAGHHHDRRSGDHPRRPHPMPRPVGGGGTPTGPAEGPPVGPTGGGGTATGTPTGRITTSAADPGHAGPELAPHRARRSTSRSWPASSSSPSAPAPSCSPGARPDDGPIRPRPAAPGAPTRR